MRPTSASKLISVIFAIFVLALPVEAQITIGGGASRRRPDGPPKPKNVHGLVQDARSKPLAGARVFVRNMKNNTTRTTTANDQGLYAINGLPPDVDYEVYADYKGKTSDKKVLSSILNREDNVFNFQLDVSVVEGGPAVKADVGPQFDTFDLVRLHASFELPTGVPAPIPAVLLLHGFGEDRSVWDSFRKQLLERGWAVMALDLRGHGESKTKNQRPLTSDASWRSSSHDFPLDLDPALAWLKAQPRLDSRKIVVIGYDVGANLALLAAGKFPEVRTIIAVKPNLNESLAMAGSAQDFHPRSALIAVSEEAEGNRLKGYVANPVKVLTLAAPSGAAQAFQNRQLTDAIFQWLKDTF